MYAYNETAIFFVLGTIYILQTQNITFSTLPSCIAYILWTPTRSYKFTLSPYKIVVLAKPHCLKFKLETLQHLDAAVCQPIKAPR